MAAFKEVRGNFQLRASVYTRIRTRNSAFQALPVRIPMVPANILVNEDSRETTAVAGGVRWGCPSRVGCKINETSKSASRCTNYQFHLWAHDQQFTVTLTEKFSTSNASIIAKPPGSRVHGNSPGFATESERHPSLPCKMRSFRLPGLLLTKRSRFHANLRASEGRSATC
jgi:hypothetical protein